MIEDISYTYNSDGTIEVERKDVIKASKFDPSAPNFYDDPSNFPQIGSDEWDKFLDSLSIRDKSSYYPIATTKLDPYVVTAGSSTGTANIDASWLNFNKYFVIYESVDLGQGLYEENIITVTPYENIAEDLHKKYGFKIRKESIGQH